MLALPGRQLGHQPGVVPGMRQCMRRHHCPWKQPCRRSVTACGRADARSPVGYQHHVLRVVPGGLHVVEQGAPVGALGAHGGDRGAAQGGGVGGRAGHSSRASAKPGHPPGGGARGAGGALLDVCQPSLDHPPGGGSRGQGSGRGGLARMGGRGSRGPRRGAGGKVSQSKLAAAAQMPSW